jgi:microcystin-dependent protein
MGQGAGLSSYLLGQLMGVENVTLNTNQMASHQHVYSPGGGSGEQTSNRPDSLYPAVGGYYAATTDSSSPMPAAAVSSAGGSGGVAVAHNNLQPFLGIQFIISMFGIFPSRS